MRLKTKLRETQAQRIEKSKALLLQARELLTGINHEVYMYENNLVIKKLDLGKKKYKSRRVSIRHKTPKGKNCKLRKTHKSEVKSMAFDMRMSLLLTSDLEGLVSLKQLCEVWKCSLPTATETAKALGLLQKNKHNKKNGRSQAFFDISRFKLKHNKSKIN